MRSGKTVYQVLGVVALLVILGCAAREGRMHQMSQREAFVRSLPDAPESARLLSKDDTAGMRSGLVVLQPGTDCGWHSTDNYEEMIICLAGAGEVATEGGGRRPLAAGQYAYNPPHTRHNVFNTGTQPMRYVYVVAPTEARGSDHH
ncbi:MAG TPA: cupin domain-containing protein [Phycisphaerae bacterium]|nr:cupin domain-containing protein [Phycisphaerae bacterium]HNU44861.1 cupin domain-containing protein [Phycisphaerae bacterium]